MMASDLDKNIVPMTQVHNPHRNMCLAGATFGVSVRRQNGIALVVALVLLIAVTLVGLAAIRGTTMQQQMTSNFFDRETAFQSAEAGLRTAELWLQNNPNSPAILDCSATSANVCLANPFDPNQVGVTIQTVSTSDYAKGDLASSQPQFVVESMGAFQDPQANTSYDQTANSMQYGGSGGAQTSNYYMITARSGDPATVGDRSVVTLQAMVKL